MRKNLQRAPNCLEQELAIRDTTPGGMNIYRKSLKSTAIFVCHYDLHLLSDSAMGFISNLTEFRIVITSGKQIRSRYKLIQMDNSILLDL